MKDFFIITNITALFFYIIFILKTKNIFSYLNLIVLGVNLHLSLYFFNWSDLIIEKRENSFYLIFICLNFLIVLFSFFSFKYKKIKFKKRYFFKNKRCIHFLNIFYIIALLLDVYMSSGTIFPLLKGIDIHTRSYSVITALLITRNTIPVILINIIFFMKNYKKIYLYYIFVLFFIPIILKGARHTVVQDITILGLFCIILYQKEFLKLIRKNFLIVLTLFVLISGMATYRSYKFYSKYNLKGNYAEWIAYKGPLKNSSFFTTYYGYYPLSFNNLNISIKDLKAKKIDFFGLNAFRGFHVFTNKLLNKEPYENAKERKYVVGAATVPTGFYDFYYDYRNLTFIPLLVSFLLSHYLFKKIYYSSQKIKWAGVYSIFCAGWLDIGMLNSLYKDTILFSVVIFIIYLNIFIKEER